MKTDINLLKIGNHIQEVRKQQGLTQKDIANKLKIDNKTVSKWENGTISIDVSYIIPLSYLLEISPEELLTGEKITNKNKEIIKIIKKEKIRNLLISITIILITLITTFVICQNIMKNNHIEKYSLLSQNEKFTVNGHVLQSGKNSNIFIKNIEFEGDLFITEIKVVANGKVLTTMRWDKKQDLKTLFNDYYIDIDTKDIINNDSNLGITIEWEEDDMTGDFDVIKLELF